MTCIRSVGTARPEHCYSKEEVSAAAERWLEESEQAKALFGRFLRSSHAESRTYALTLAEILGLNGAQGRAELYAERATPLAEQALRNALAGAQVQPEKITNLVFTSCSVPLLPSIDALVVQRAGLSESVHRVPIYQQGCAGGVIGLNLAERLIRPGGAVALVCVELCSLVFHLSDASPAQLVGSAIFADGAAGAIIGPEDRGLVFAGTHSCLIPETRHLLGYDIYDDGTHLRLHHELPQAVAEHTPRVVETFLRGKGLSVRDIAWWLFHPGGVKICDMLEQSLKLRPEQAYWAREILYRNGNLSSATILFVLEEFEKSNVVCNGDYVIMAGIGPGLTIELILFQFRK
ncbi:MAG TPA: type III polyketide synthase [Oligoflexia bacterium]|nr:type III polyketide synthase [Oligoflexia bacterium]